MEYSPWAQAHLSDPKDALDRLSACFSDLFTKPLTAINAWIIEKWRAQKLKDGAKPSTVNRDLAALRSVISRAVEWQHLELHPFRTLKQVREDDEGVVRWLSEMEEIRLRQSLDGREERLRKERDTANAWRQDRGYQPLLNLREIAFADHLKPMILLSLNTGLRRGELFHMTWQDVDMERRQLTIRGKISKSGRVRYIPLNVEAFETLRQWKRQTPAEGVVFPNSNGRPFDNVQSAWEKLLIAADIKKFRWHDIRHHFASRLVMAGVGLNTVRQLLGHSDIKMTLRYAHLSQQHIADAVSNLSPPSQSQPKLRRVL